MQKTSKTDKSRVAHEIAYWMLKEQKTIREAAVRFNFSKSYVHVLIRRHVTRDKNNLFSRRVDQLLKSNLADGPRRGGKKSSEARRKRRGKLVAQQ